MINAEELARFLYLNQDWFINDRHEISIRDLADAITEFREKEERLPKAALLDARKV